TSAGLLWCKPISLFSAMMDLEDPASLVRFLIVRRDASYVVQSPGALKDDYFSKLKAYCQPEGMSSDEAEESLKRAIASSGTFSLNARYVDRERGIDERRSILATPLKDSNWYLVAVIPYGVLDEVIAGLGASMGRGAVLCAVLLACGVVLAFLPCVWVARRQMLEIQDARDRAEAASRSKSEFLSNMSHDIRTPMNAIVGLTGIARSHMDETARVEDCLKKIMIAGKQLLGLVNDVLDMSKIESGKMTLKLEDVCLRETMETMCDIVRPQVRAKGQSFDVFISSILAERVYCDEVRISQVLLNFLSNAMKFTPEGGVVDIELWQEPSPRGSGWVRTHFAVKDTGIGMSEEFRQKLFTAFEREDSRRVHRTQGTGLGLAIVKYIVDAMEGTIEVETAPGKGTRFHVTVDLERVPVEEDEMRLPPWQVLVVDDSRELCRTAGLSLQELGARPQCCYSGEDAVELVRGSRDGGGFFAALIDYKMDGGMNGIETAVKIREIVGDGMSV
ncbi:MAG: hypothetical protein J5600_02275, partial [Desulfovibrio sp.]|nr:hypothetical protein [Desulfovibrio sp.]